MLSFPLDLPEQSLFGLEYGENRHVSGQIDCAGTKKAKDWDGFGVNGKKDPVGIPKLHDIKFLRGWGSMHDRVRLMLHWSYSVAVHASTPRSGVLVLWPSIMGSVRAHTQSIPAGSHSAIASLRGPHAVHGWI